MGSELWKQFPSGLLKKTQRGFLKLHERLQALVVELAEKQNFKCACCEQNYDLIIEHDHDHRNASMCSEGVEYWIPRLRGA
jgi:hypothetical protein